MLAMHHKMIKIKLYARGKNETKRIHTKQRTDKPTVC